MHLGELITPERVSTQVDCVSKKRVFEEIASIIAGDFPTLDQYEIFTALINRENLGSTGLGEGIAIPHCRINNCPQAIGALITLSNPIEFDAIDDKPVDILCALIVPDEDNDIHLQSLGLIAQYLSNETLLNDIRKAKTPDELINVIASLGE